MAARLQKITDHVYMKGKNELIDNKKEMKLIPIVTLPLSNCALAENPYVTAM